MIDGRFGDIGELFLEIDLIAADCVRVCARTRSGDH